MNKHKIIDMLGLIVIGGLIWTCIHLNTSYNAKISDMKNTYESKIASLTSEKSSLIKEKNTFKYLYDSQETDLTEAKESVGKAQSELQELKSKIFISEKKTESLSRGNYRYNDLSNYAIMTVDEMNKWIKDRAPANSPFINKGKFFLELSQKYDLDPKYIVAHAALESGWGEKTLGKSNYFGIGAYNTSPVTSAYTFTPGLESGIDEGVNWIYSNYYNKGKKSLYTMQYSGPAYAQNNDGSPNTAWLDRIENIIYP